MMNERFTISLLLVLFLSLTVISTNSFANGDSDPNEVEMMVKEEVILPNPQREYCMLSWNKYYSENKIDIKVSTRGQYDEIVVFTCPDCSLEKHYVDPFLETETNGLTGAQRIKACGFLKAQFKGSKGLRVIERDI